MDAPVLTRAKPQRPHQLSKDKAEDNGDALGILLRVFYTLERAGIPYCVLHGYEDFSQGIIASDVDCLIGKGPTARELLALFHRNRDFIGADIVRSLSFYFVFAGRTNNGPFFLALDFARNYDVGDLPLYDGEDVLASRRRYSQFYAPAADVEFGCLLTRAVAKQKLSAERAHTLTRFFSRDSDSCTMHATRHFSGANAKLVEAAARCGNWDPVRERLSELRAELRQSAIARRPTRFIVNKFYGFAGRVQRLLRPDGISVVFLGPDGAGKSSVIDRIGLKLAAVFPRWVCWGIVPGLNAIFRRGKRSTAEPHGLPPRSLTVSLLRLAYWFAYYTFERLALRTVLARSTLVLFDRHFIDILVDQKRYRYGGPVWMLHLLGWFIPKPDIVILLDAPTEVLQSRKQEVSFETTEHQRKAYLDLITALPNGFVADASDSRERVVNVVSEIILN